MIERIRSLIARLNERPEYAKWAQFIKFGVVGLSNTAISYITYIVCLKVFGLHYQLCNVIAFVVSVTNAYYWNSRYVFNKGIVTSWKIHIVNYCKCVASYALTGLLLTALLLKLWVDMVGISESIAPLINLLITIPVNFLLNKYWAFKDKHTATVTKPIRGDENNEDD